ncbi:unnamed protein product [Orchesella dallaii]|uniref:Uncharacterized protein n=1 Tax=Orchesella dallaii TaxID=48710 RepID=A0ABP1RPC6_9HEXA
MNCGLHLIGNQFGINIHLTHSDSLILLCETFWSVVTQVVWISVLEVGGQLYSNGNTTINSWKEHHWGSRFGNRVMKKFTKCCKPIRLGYDDTAQFPGTNASSFDELLMFLSILNGQSYGKPAIFVAFFDDLKTRDERCMQQLDYKKDRNIMYSAVRDCIASFFTYVFDLLSSLNTTLKISSRPLDDVELNWHLQIRSDEGILQGIPNVYAQTRGRIFSEMEMAPQVMACNYADSLSRFDFSLLKHSIFLPC